MDINQINLLGNVANDPEFRTTNNKKNVVNFRLMTNEKYLDKNTGEEVENKQSTNIVFWGYPEFMKKALKKGSRVLVNNGKLQTRSYEDEGNEKHFITEVVVSYGVGAVVLFNKKDNEPENQE